MDRSRSLSEVKRPIVKDPNSSTMGQSALLPESDTDNVTVCKLWKLSICEHLQYNSRAIVLNIWTNSLRCRYSLCFGWRTAYASSSRCSNVRKRSRFPEVIFSSSFNQNFSSFSIRTRIKSRQVEELITENFITLMHTRIKSRQVTIISYHVHDYMEILRPFLPCNLYSSS